MASRNNRSSIGATVGDLSQPAVSQVVRPEEAINSTAPTSIRNYGTRSSIEAEDSFENEGAADGNFANRPRKLRLRCQRSGEPQGDRNSKKIGCPHYIDVEVEFDEDGELFFIVTGWCGHENHTPGDTDDKRWLPLEKDAEEYIEKVSQIFQLGAN